MIGAALACLLSAVPVGACADRPACRFGVGEDAALKEALESLELVPGKLKAEPLKTPGGDLAFELSSARRGDEVVVKAVSLHRPVGIFGEGAARVVPVKEAFKARALVSALKLAIPRALEDLALRIAGVRRLVLSVQLSGLDGKARAHAESALLPCLKGLFELTGPVTSPSANAGFLDEAVEYLPEKGEPREPLTWQVNRVRDALLGGVRSKCSVSGGPLQGWATSVTADAVNRAVVISFKR